MTIFRTRFIRLLNPQARKFYSIFPYLKPFLASLVLWDIPYTRIQLSRHESIRVQNSTVKVSKYSHVITKTRLYSNCFHPRIGRVKINAPETLCATKKCATKKFRFTAKRTSKREDERGRKANIERQYELAEYKIVTRIAISGSLLICSPSLAVCTRYTRGQRWRKRGVRHGPITRIVPRTVNRGTHRRDDDVSREKHCERNGSLLPPSFFFPSFYLRHRVSALELKVINVYFSAGTSIVSRLRDKLMVLVGYIAWEIS